MDCYNRQIKEILETITTRVNDSNETFILEKTDGWGLPIKNKTKKGYIIAEIGDGIDISKRMIFHRGTVQKGISQTITTQINVGVLVRDDR